MNKGEPGKQHLRLLRGGRASDRRLGGVRLVVSPREDPPFRVDALVIEDDTYLVLSADTEYRSPREHPLRVLTAAHETEPASLGSIVARSGSPPILLAVVHDLGREPTWREEWVVSALTEVLAHVRQRQLSAIGLEPLAAVHGRLGVARFIEILETTTKRVEATDLERIWLILTPEQEKEAKLSR